MDIIIYRFGLPEDIEKCIKEFLYNSQGYSLYHLKKIDELRKKIGEKY